MARKSPPKNHPQKANKPHTLNLDNGIPLSKKRWIIEFTLYRGRIKKNKFELKKFDYHGSWIPIVLLMLFVFSFVFAIYMNLDASLKEKIISFGLKVFLKKFVKEQNFLSNLIYVALFYTLKINL